MICFLQFTGYQANGSGSRNDDPNGNRFGPWGPTNDGTTTIFIIPLILSVIIQIIGVVQVGGSS